MTTIHPADNPVDINMDKAENLHNLNAEDTLDETSHADEIDSGLTENQSRLLYLVDLHTKKNENESQEKWIRKPALSVLIYEGTVADIFDYDYAPQSQLVEHRRVWLNVSQEGFSDLEYLREEELVCTLHLSSKLYVPVTCYQVTEKGKAVVRSIPRNHKEVINGFAYVGGSSDLLNIFWDGDQYWIRSTTGYNRRSTVTDIEDVSYVSSAYIPSCLRYEGRPTYSNAHRCHETGASLHTARDEFDELITLSSVSLVVAEYVPFGPNEILQISNRAGCSDRVQGGFISTEIDTGNNLALEMNPELTSIEILDFRPTNYINLEAEINLAEAPGIVQIETFGVSLNSEGTCFYGMQVESVMDRIKDNISLDQLSRLLVDVQQDSTVITDSFISEHQKDLLNTVFLGDAPNRNKINLLIANAISPNMTAEEFMDRGEYENEFKQVIGDTKAAYDISEQDILVFGSNGLLICGPHCRHHETLLCAYLQFKIIDIFLQQIFSRIWVLGDDVAMTSKISETEKNDPSVLSQIRYRISKLNRDVVQFQEILDYVTEALQEIGIPDEPTEQTGRALYARLEISGMKAELSRRAVDIRKNVVTSERYLGELRERAHATEENFIGRLARQLDHNTSRLCQLQESSVRSSHSLQIMQFFFSGILAFQILDRVTGDWSVVDTLWMMDFVNTMVKGNPMVWFLISILMWVAVAVSATKVYALLNWKSQGLTFVKLTLGRRIFLDKLKLLLTRKTVSKEEKQFDGGRTIVKITYVEFDPREWGGIRPTITMEYDEVNCFLLVVTIVYNKRFARKSEQIMSAGQLKEKVLTEFENFDLFDMKSEDYSFRDLACDKRAYIEKMIKHRKESESVNAKLPRPDL
eukprot:CAMPEP_0113309168 /NCGR_PEP_ID=MMETSP0010_2-20120614/7320_1 /TAXON_ID=216773 ORGANISM="Corethron hystrix, Strain 308" /NCGR_SAMPLE_ID=MMETSP0010_2 /ASSEMBLY_ACC=CAM_ASM_000155 /LENGTH=865 /DNA_ID=CAMNT_0000164367 /DNA_START=1679 /DNA_END=4276 /DNA_ORIENTATION=- /assembly_acc=CAM_ASM_000155